MRAIVAVLLFVSAVHAALWGVLQEKLQAPDFNGILPSVSYAPFEGTEHPDVDNIPSAEKIRADLKKLSTITRAIRLYSSTGGVEMVPPIAAEFGIKVTLGVWIDKHTDRNDREIESAINLARRNSNVIGIVVGVAASILISRLAQWTTDISALSVVASFLFSAAVGVFFGYYPARKAAFLNPIEALRYE